MILVDSSRTIIPWNLLWYHTPIHNIMSNYGLFTQKRIFILIVALLLLSLAVIVSVIADDDTFDNSIYVARSNVVQSQVDPSFWDERESLSITKVKKPLVLPTNMKYPLPVCSSPGNLFDAKLTPKNHAVTGKAQEVALILVNSPYYQAGESVFKLDDKTQVQLSSVKYAATREYYGRTDISSSWVTDFYNAAYCEDYPNLTLLLEELPPEV